MRYGRFDDDAREYVITRPDTPRSWSNYLGSTEYGAIITNNAGGYGFYKSGARGRFMRLRFNSVPMDQPGRYFYLRDRDSGEYWSTSWQPVGKPLDRYESVCRHGMGYTIIESRFAGIATSTTYFVPMGETFEYWRLRVTNEGDRPRHISAFSFCEVTNQWDTHQDLVNLQYSLFIVRGGLADGILRIAIQDNLANDSEALDLSDIARHTWMAAVGAPLSGYDTSREAFLGPYRGYHNPLAVERGACSNSDAYGDNACCSLQTDLTLAPGEAREVLLLFGIGDARTVGKRTLRAFGSFERADQEFERLKRSWHAKLGSLTAQTPDDELNHTVNVWGPYNALVAFAWSRAASLVYSGERDGLGFRDSVQDVLGAVAAVPEEARARLRLMLCSPVRSPMAAPSRSFARTSIGPDRNRRPRRRSTAPMTAYGSSTPSPRTSARPETWTSIARSSSTPIAAKPPRWATCGALWNSTSSGPVPTAFRAASPPIGTTACGSATAGKACSSPFNSDSGCRPTRRSPTAWDSPTRRRGHFASASSSMRASSHARGMAIASSGLSARTEPSTEPARAKRGRST